jgi:hypothetical protein
MLFLRDVCIVPVYMNHVVHVSCICRVISLVHVKSQWLNGSDVIWDVNSVDNSFNHTLIYILFSAEDNSHLRTGRRPQYYSLVLSIPRRCIMG